MHTAPGIGGVFGREKIRALLLEQWVKVHLIFFVILKHYLSLFDFLLFLNELKFTLNFN